jgi:hypothetical protein
MWSHRRLDELSRKRREFLDGSKAVINEDFTRVNHRSALVVVLDAAI